MEHVKKYEKRYGADAGYHSSNMDPVNREGCVGKSGLDKTLSLENVLAIAYKMPEKPNIVIKAGPNRKWYLKRFPLNVLDDEIEKQKWRDITQSTMHIIEWD
jgi:hypothetical protein